MKITSKILFLGYNINPPWADGTVNAIRYIAQALANKAQVHIWTTKDKSLDFEESINRVKYKRIYNVKNAKSYKMLSFFPEHFYLISALFHSLFSKEKYNAVFTNFGYGFFKGFFRILLFPGTKKVELVHGIPTKMRFLSFLPDSVYFKIAFTGAKEIICFAKKTQLKLQRYTNKDVLHFPLLIDTDTFHPFQSKIKKAFPIEKNDLVFLYFGHFKKGKGINTILTCFKKLTRKNKNVKLILAWTGGGNRKKEIKNHVNELKIGNYVFFTGLQKNVMDLINAADIILFPIKHSRYVANIPLSVLEAMACGKVVIASRMEGTKELIKDSVDGFLYDPQDGEKLFAISLRLIKNKSLRMKIGAAALAKIKKNYSIKNNLELYESLIQE